MSTRVYGQYCGFARALEVVGERWAMLIIRDLLVASKRFSDLHRGLAGIPTNILTTRLKELEAAGIVRREVLPRPANSVVYTLTPHGRDLEDTVLALGRWGAKKLGEPREHEVVTAESLITALRTTFQPKRAAKDRWIVALRAGEIGIHARIDRGTIEVKDGLSADPDLTIEAGAGMRALMAGEVTAREALDRGLVRITGPEELLERFARTFSIGAIAP